MRSRVIEPEIQFANLDHQGETAQLGMWVFLLNETLFFGALIFIYFLYRISYSRAFDIAGKEAVLWCGSTNLVLLLTSSLTMVLAINAGAQGRRRSMVWWLIATLGLGTMFLFVKGFEYHLDFQSKVVPAINFETRPGAGPAGERSSGSSTGLPPACTRSICRSVSASCSTCWSGASAGARSRLNTTHRWKS
jgi:cytochrome c oxidase subunit III